MLKKLNVFAVVVIVALMSACSSAANKDTTSGDAGDSSTIGAGTDTAGSRVDTGAAGDNDTATTE
ncbi:hypothetical protein [Desertivirga brevis]|uniref:hypothetical protein n=1 Tax=Desertivirga brevis TaxID=2810310 RepID=UPI001A974915|nr:hypothetical protein [Pedobacter sp. SYSU D00873]